MWPVKLVKSTSADWPFAHVTWIESGAWASVSICVMMKLHEPMTVATASAILCPGVRRATAGGSSMS